MKMIKITANVVAILVLQTFRSSVGAIIEAELPLSMAPTEDQNVCNTLIIITTFAVILLLKY